MSLSPKMSSSQPSSSASSSASTLGEALTPPLASPTMPTPGQEDQQRLREVAADTETRSHEGAPWAGLGADQPSPPPRQPHGELLPQQPIPSLERDDEVTDTNAAAGEEEQTRLGAGGPPAVPAGHHELTGTAQQQQHQCQKGDGGSEGNSRAPSSLSGSTTSARSRSQPPPALQPEQLLSGLVVPQPPATAPAQTTPVYHEEEESSSSGNNRTARPDGSSAQDLSSSQRQQQPHGQGGTGEGGTELSPGRRRGPPARDSTATATATLPSCSQTFDEEDSSPYFPISTLPQTAANSATGYGSLATLLTSQSQVHRAAGARSPPGRDADGEGGQEEEKERVELPTLLTGGVDGGSRAEDLPGSPRSTSGRPADHGSLLSPDLPPATGPDGGRRHSSQRSSSVFMGRSGNLPSLGFATTPDANGTRGSFVPSTGSTRPPSTHHAGSASGSQRHNTCGAERLVASSPSPPPPAPKEDRHTSLFSAIEEVAPTRRKGSRSPRPSLRTSPLPPLPDRPAAPAARVHTDDVSSHHSAIDNLLSSSPSDPSLLAVDGRRSTLRRTGANTGAASGPASSRQVPRSKRHLSAKEEEAAAAPQRRPVADDPVPLFEDTETPSEAPDEHEENSQGEGVAAREDDARAPAAEDAVMAPQQLSPPSKEQPPREEATHSSSSSQAEKMAAPATPTDEAATPTPAAATPAPSSDEHQPPPPPHPGAEAEGNRVLSGSVLTIGSAQDNFLPVESRHSGTPASAPLSPPALGGAFSPLQQAVFTAQDPADGTATATAAAAAAGGAAAGRQGRRSSGGDGAGNSHRNSDDGEGHHQEGGSSSSYYSYSYSDYTYYDTGDDEEEGTDEDDVTEERDRREEMRRRRQSGQRRASSPAFSARESHNYRGAASPETSRSDGNSSNDGTESVVNSQAHDERQQRRLGHGRRGRGRLGSEATSEVDTLEEDTPPRRSHTGHDNLDEAANGHVAADVPFGQDGETGVGHTALHSEEFVPATSATRAPSHSSSPVAGAGAGQLPPMGGVAKDKRKSSTTSRRGSQPLLYRRTSIAPSLPSAVYSATEECYRPSATDPAVDSHSDKNGGNARNGDEQCQQQQEGQEQGSQEGDPSAAHSPPLSRRPRRSSASVLLSNHIKALFTGKRKGDDGTASSLPTNRDSSSTGRTVNVLNFEETSSRATAQTGATGGKHLATTTPTSTRPSTSGGGAAAGSATTGDGPSAQDGSPRSTSSAAARPLAFSASLSSSSSNLDTPTGNLPSFPSSQTPRPPGLERSHDPKSMRSKVSGSSTRRRRLRPRKEAPTKATLPPPPALSFLTETSASMLPAPSPLATGIGGSEGELPTPPPVAAPEAEGRQNEDAAGNEEDRECTVVHPTRRPDHAEGDGDRDDGDADDELVAHYAFLHEGPSVRLPPPLHAEECCEAIPTLVAVGFSEAVPPLVAWEAEPPHPVLREDERLRPLPLTALVPAPKPRAFCYVELHALRRLSVLLCRQSLGSGGSAADNGDSGAAAVVRVSLYACSGGGSEDQGRLLLSTGSSFALPSSVRALARKGSLDSWSDVLFLGDKADIVSTCPFVVLQLERARACEEEPAAEGTTVADSLLQPQQSKHEERTRGEEGSPQEVSRRSVASVVLEQTPAPAPAPRAVDEPDETPASASASSSSSPASNPTAEVGETSDDALNQEREPHQQDAALHTPERSTPSPCYPSRLGTESPSGIRLLSEITQQSHGGYSMLNAIMANSAATATTTTTTTTAEASRRSQAPWRGGGVAWTPLAVSSPLPVPLLLASASGPSSPVLVPDMSQHAEAESATAAAAANTSLPFVLYATHEACRLASAPVAPEDIAAVLKDVAQCSTAEEEEEREAVQMVLHAVTDATLVVVSAGDPLVPCAVCTAESEPFYGQPVPTPGHASCGLPEGRASAPVRRSRTMKSPAILRAIARYAFYKAQLSDADGGNMLPFPKDEEDATVPYGNVDALQALSTNRDAARSGKQAARTTVLWNTMPKQTPAATGTVWPRARTSGFPGRTAVPSSCSVLLHVTVAFLEQLPVLDGDTHSPRNIASASAFQGFPYPHVALQLSGGSEGGTLGTTSVPAKAMWAGDGDDGGEGGDGDRDSCATQAPVVRFDYKLHTNLSTSGDGGTLLLSLHTAMSEEAVLGQAFFNPFTGRVGRGGHRRCVTDAAWLPLYTKACGDSGRESLARVGWLHCQYECIFAQNGDTATTLAKLSDALVLYSRQEQQQQQRQSDDARDESEGERRPRQPSMVLDLTVVSASGLAGAGDGRDCNALCQVEALLVYQRPSRHPRSFVAQQQQRTAARTPRAHREEALPPGATTDSVTTSTIVHSNVNKSQRRGGGGRGLPDAGLAANTSFFSSSPYPSGFLSHSHDDFSADEGVEEDALDGAADAEGRDGPFITETARGTGFPAWRHCFRLDVGAVSRLLLRVFNQRPGAPFSLLASTALSSANLSRMWLGGEGGVWLPLSAPRSPQRIADNTPTMTAILLRWSRADGAAGWRNRQMPTLSQAFPCATRCLAHRADRSEEEDEEEDSEVTGGDATEALLAATVGDPSSAPASCPLAWLEVSGVSLVWPWLYHVATSPGLFDTGSFTLVLSLDCFGTLSFLGSWRLIPAATTAASSASLLARRVRPSRGSSSSSSSFRLEAVGPVSLCAPVRALTHTYGTQSLRWVVQWRSASGSRTATLSHGVWLPSSPGQPMQPFTKGASIVAMPAAGQPWAPPPSLPSASTAASALSLPNHTEQGCLTFHYAYFPRLSHLPALSPTTTTASSRVWRWPSVGTEAYVKLRVEEWVFFPANTHAAASQTESDSEGEGAGEEFPSADGLPHRITELRAVLGVSLAEEDAFSPRVAARPTPQAIIRQTTCDTVRRTPDIFTTASIMGGGGDSEVSRRSSVARGGTMSAAARSATTAGAAREAAAAPAPAPGDALTTALLARWPPRQFEWANRPAPNLEIWLTDPVAASTAGEEDGVSARVGTVPLPAMAALSRRKGTTWLPIRSPDADTQVRGYAFVRYEHNFTNESVAQAEFEGTEVGRESAAPPAALLLVQVAAAHLREGVGNGGDADSVLIGYEGHTATVTVPPQPSLPEREEAAGHIIAFPIDKRCSRADGGALRFQVRGVGPLGGPPPPAEDADNNNNVPTSAAAYIPGSDLSLPEGPATFLERPVLRERWLPLVSRCGADAASATAMAAGELLVRWSVWPVASDGRSVVRECAAAFRAWHGGAAEVTVLHEEDGEDEEGTECGAAETTHLAEREDSALQQAWAAFVGERDERAGDGSAANSFLVLSRLVWELPAETKSRLLSACGVGNVWVEVASTYLSGCPASCATTGRGEEEEFLDQTDVHELREGTSWAVDELIYPLPTPALAGAEIAEETLQVRVLGSQVAAAAGEDEGTVCLATGSAVVQHHPHYHCRGGGGVGVSDPCEVCTQPQLWAAPLTIPRATRASLDLDGERAGRLTWLMEEKTHPFARPSPELPLQGKAEVGASVLLHLTLGDMTLRGVDLTAPVVAGGGPSLSVRAEVVSPPSILGGNGSGSSGGTTTVGRQHARPERLGHALPRTPLDTVVRTVPLVSSFTEPEEGVCSQPTRWDGDVCTCLGTTMTLYVTIPAAVVLACQRRALAPDTAMTASTAAAAALATEEVRGSSPASSTHGKATVRVEGEMFGRVDDKDGDPLTSPTVGCKKKLTLTDAATGRWLGEAVLTMTLLASSVPVLAQDDTTACAPAPPPSHLFIARTVRVAAWRCVGPIEGDLALLQRSWETCQQLRMEAAVAAAHGVPLGKPQRRQLAEAAATLSAFLKRSAVAKDDERREQGTAGERDGRGGRVALQLSLTLERSRSQVSQPFYALDASTFVARALDGSPNESTNGLQPLVQVEREVGREGTGESRVTASLQLQAAVPDESLTDANQTVAVPLGVGQWHWAMPSDAAMAAIPEVNHTAWMPVYKAAAAPGAGQGDPIASVLVRTTARELVVRGDMTLGCVCVLSKLLSSAGPVPLRFPCLCFTYAFADGTRHAQYMPLFSSVASPTTCGDGSSVFWALSSVRVPRVGVFGGRILRVDLLDYTEAPCTPTDTDRQRHERRRTKEEDGAATEAEAEAEVEVTVARRGVVGVVLATHRWTAEDEAALFTDRVSNLDCGDSGGYQEVPRVSPASRMHWLRFSSDLRILLSLSTATPTTPVARATTVAAPFAIQSVSLHLRSTCTREFTAVTPPPMTCTLAAACCTDEQAEGGHLSPWHVLAGERNAASYHLTRLSKAAEDREEYEEKGQVDGDVCSLSACWDLATGTSAAFAAHALQGRCGGAAARLRLTFALGERRHRYSMTCRVAELVEVSQCEDLCVAALPLRDGDGVVVGEVKVRWSLLLPPPSSPQGDVEEDGRAACVPVYEEKLLEPASSRVFAGRREADIIRELTDKLTPWQHTKDDGVAGRAGGQRYLASLAEDARRIEEMQMWLDVLVRAQKAQERAPRRRARKHWAWVVTAMEVEGVRPTVATPPGPLLLLPPPRAGGPGGSGGDGVQHAAARAGVPLLAQLRFPTVKETRRRHGAAEKGRQEAVDTPDIVVGVARGETHGAPGRSDNDAAGCIACFQPMEWKILCRDVSKAATRRGASVTLWQLLRDGRGEVGGDDDADGRAVALLGSASLRDLFSDLRDLTEAAIADLEEAAEAWETVVLPAPVLRTDWLSMQCPSPKMPAGSSATTTTAGAAASAPLPRVRLLLRAPWANSNGDGHGTSKSGQPERGPGDGNSSSSNANAGGVAQDRSATISALLTSVTVTPSDQDDGAPLPSLSNIALFITVLQSRGHDAAPPEEPSYSFHTSLLPFINHELSPVKGVEEEAKPQSPPQPPASLPVAPVPVDEGNHADERTPPRKDEEEEEKGCVGAAASPAPPSAAGEAVEQRMMPTKPLFLWQQRQSSSSSPRVASAVDVHLRIYVAECAPSSSLLDEPLPLPLCGPVRHLLGTADCLARLPLPPLPHTAIPCAASTKDVHIRIPLQAHGAATTATVATLALSVRLCSGPTEAQANVMANAERVAAKVAADRRRRRDSAAALPKDRQGGGQRRWRRRQQQPSREQCGGDGSAFSSPCLREAMSEMKVLTVPWPPLCPLELAVWAVRANHHDTGGSSTADAESGIVLLGCARTTTTATTTTVRGGGCLVEGGLSLRVLGGTATERTLQRSRQRDHFPTSRRLPRVPVRQRIAGNKTKDHEATPAPTTATAATSRALFCPSSPPPPPLPLTGCLATVELKPNLSLIFSGQEQEEKGDEEGPCYVGHVAAQTAGDDRVWLLGGCHAADGAWSTDVRCMKPLQACSSTLWTPPALIRAADRTGVAPLSRQWAVPTTTPFFASAAAMAHGALVFLFGGLAPQHGDTVVASNALHVFDTARLMWYRYPSPAPCSAAAQEHGAEDRDSDSSSSNETEREAAWPAPRFGHRVVRLPSSDTKSSPPLSQSSSSSFFIVCGGATSPTQLVAVQDMLWVCELHEQFGCRWRRMPLPSPSSLHAALTPRFEPELRFAWINPEDIAPQEWEERDRTFALTRETESMWAAGTLRMSGGAQHAISPAAAAGMVSAYGDGLSPLVARLPAFSWWLSAAMAAEGHTTSAAAVSIHCVCPREATL